jgi:nicotinamidase/pyrazinamidase
MNPILLRESALVVVDVQQGFTTLCPRELPVPRGLEIVPAINRMLTLDWARIDASVDWHPPDHRSFFGQADNLYPPHCVQNTPGADFVPGLDTRRFHTIWRKGFQRDFEAYAVTAQHPGIVALYGDAKVATVVVCGIAINICCYFTARDFCRAGCRVVMVEDGSAGIDVPAAGLFQEKAKEEGIALGIEYALSHQLVFA